jgi:hypothetical protein
MDTDRAKRPPGRVNGAAVSTQHKGENGMSSTWFIAIIGFLGLLAFVVVIRSKWGSKLEVKNSDIVLALIPIALWLFGTGEVKEVAFGDLKISKAIKEASSKPVEKQVTQLPVEEVKVGKKTTVDKIPRLIQDKTQALGFKLGYGRYSGDAIEKYLSSMIQFPFFKYVIITNPDGRFFGIIEARLLHGLITQKVITSIQFADWLNSANTNELLNVTGLLSSKNALNKSSDKLRALNDMDRLDLQVLPVVSDDGSLFGIVDRSKLTASIIADISNKIDHK